MTRVRADRALRTGDRFEPPAELAHHLGHVLRLSPGAEVVVVDAEGAAWSGRLAPGPPLALEIAGPADEPDANPRRIVGVWVPLLKGGRTDDLIRQLTELGASRIVPFTSERTVARPDARRAERQHARWRRIAAEATRQCRRTDLPEIAPVSALPTEGPGIFLWEEATVPVREVWGPSDPLRLLTGPEGGLSAGEAARLEALGWRAATLGPRLLRAETAAIAALTLALHALGEGGY